MATRPEERMMEPDMNPADLWIEEVYTDRRIGTLRKLTPVKGDGERDDSRDVQWVGETQVLSQIGTLPITFPLEAKTLEEAAKKFGAEAKKGHRAHGAGAAGNAPAGGVLDRDPAGRAAADASRRRSRRRQDPDSVVPAARAAPRKPRQTSSHSLRMAASFLTSAGVPSKTMRPCPMT
jgi:hypothetical protein